MTIPRRVKYGVKLGAAFCGLIASFLLFYSLQIASSSFKPIATKDGATNLCFNGRLLAAGFGGPLGLSGACPGWDAAKPAALVSGEHPKFVTWGFVLLLISFGFQFVDICVSPPS